MRTLVLTAASAGLLLAQAPASNQIPSNQQNAVRQESQPLYKVTVVSRSTPAVNFRHRGGSTDLDMRGTAIAPEIKGKAEVESKQGAIQVKLELKNLQPAQRFGPEYLTYVLWGISPEGRAVNMGEVLLNRNGETEMRVTTELQTFGMIVTAEPYYAVTQPSDVVVAENYVRDDTRGRVEVIDAKYELLKRGSYVYNAGQSTTRNIPRDPSKIQLDLYQARNAVQIARWTGADKYATDSFNKAEALLRQAEDYHARKQDKPTSTVARQAAQTAEDARLIALDRQEQERLANERRAAAEREAAERARAAEAEQQQRLEAQRRAQAEEIAKLEAMRRAQADAERIAAERAKAEAMAERQAADKAKAEAEAARLAALQQQQAAQAEAERARLAASEAERARLAAEQDKERLRQQLLQQFNMILETRDTARGLIVNMSDVLFDTGKYTLRPAAREKLARVSGIILAHPGLRIEVEGHTDSVGSDEYNQRLSEQRANSVREYLLTQGLSPTILTAKGFGETIPVATNDTAAGRQQNRRVELVVSGEVIGTKLSEIRPSTAVPPTQ